jgi:hypothetical protein
MIIMFRSWTTINTLCGDLQRALSGLLRARFLLTFVGFFSLLTFVGQAETHIQQPVKCLNETTALRAR